MELSTFVTFIVAGFAAQLIDGSLGMGYGVSCNIFLMSFGVPPLLASASIHAAEVFTTGASGLSHWRLGNVDRRLFRKLVVPGVAGAVVGAYLLTRFDGDVIRPFVAVYLLIMGLVIIVKAVRRSETREVKTHLVPLGVVGGFFDAIGGGGWGPIVTSTLVARGNHPHRSVGSVNLAEFFVALSVSLTLLGSVAIETQGLIIAGLVLGGLLASPLAAYLSNRLPARRLMALTGVLILALSANTILTFLTS